ncbi:MAG: YdeI/OmpD-associated family protein [Pontibacterium sp.]
MCCLVNVNNRRVNNKSSRYVIAYGLTSAKKPETRQRRFTKYMAMLVNEEKPQ